MAAEKVMVVDDNKEFLKELSEILYLFGYNPTVVSDSMEAIKLARRLRPDVVLLDLRMNGNNGFQIAKELKQNKETSLIPIIAMSGYFPIENQSILLDMSNMDGRIKKPFAVLDLISRIETALDGDKNKVAVIDDED